MKRQQTGQRET